MNQFPKLLTVIVPVYNEEKTIAKILDKIEAVSLPGWKKEIIIVNDGSTDQTGAILKKLESRYLILRHPKNLGKGAAIKTALAKTNGEYVLIQDADLEYDPADWPKILKALDEKTAAVYGSRNLGGAGRGYFHYYFGGRFLTLLTNFLFKSNLTDVNAGYKLFWTNILKSMDLKSRGFEFCEEVTCKILKNDGVIKEVSVSYSPRTFKEGKKITARDGLIGIWTIIKNKF